MSLRSRRDDVGAASDRLKDGCMGETESVHRIAILGTHLPRRCGIATFGSALADAIERVRRGVDCFAVAINDV
jgi:hypothetical protein